MEPIKRPYGQPAGRASPWSENKGEPAGEHERATGRTRHHAVCQGRPCCHPNGARNLAGVRPDSTSVDASMMYWAMTDRAVSEVGERDGVRVPHARALGHPARRDGGRCESEALWVRWDDLDVDCLTWRRSSPKNPSKRTRVAHPSDPKSLSAREAPGGFEPPH